MRSRTNKQQAEIVARACKEIYQKTPPSWSKKNKAGILWGDFENHVVVTEVAKKYDLNEDFLWTILAVEL